jgi:hypothetical protein
MKIHSSVVVLALVGCSDKGDDSGTGGGGDDSNPTAEDADSDGYAVGDDCNDGNAAINPGAAEICDTVDNDCDGTTDVGATDATAYYADGDADAYGAGKATMSCAPVAGMIATGGDCDDANKAIHPGAAEVCDDLDVDEDCDTLIDDDDDSLDTTTATLTVYIDADGDGFGTDGTKVTVCDVDTGYSASGGDCDDASTAAHPGAAEVCGDAIDEDCDGEANSCRYSGDIDPADAYAHLKGEAGRYLGYDTTPTGDINGDGFGDLAVGMGSASGEGYGAFLYNGPVSGTIEAKAASADITNAAASDGTGLDVQGIDDQDGDGYDDLMITSGMNSTSGYSGGVYVLLGPITGTDAVDEAASATIAGESSNYIGWYPSAGDVNDDGIVDLMLGGPGTNFSTGAAYIFYGPVTSGDLTTADDADASFTGLNSADWTGGCNAANGDVDGDGVNDVLVSAEQSDHLDVDDGASYLFMGPVSGAYAVDEADTMFVGGPAYWHLGWFSSIGGDLDGDGLDDVGLTAPNGYVDGAVYIVYADDIAGASELDVSKVGATVLGDKGAYQQLGYYMDTAGDLDSDGNDDLAIGSYVSDGASGTAWMFYGPISGTTYASDASFVVHGSKGQAMGASTVFVNDVTGDGADDLAIGANNTTIGGAYGSGIVLLFNGTAK